MLAVRVGLAALLLGNLAGGLAAKDLAAIRDVVTRVRESGPGSNDGHVSGSLRRA